MGPTGHEVKGSTIGPSVDHDTHKWVPLFMGPLNPTIYEDPHIFFQILFKDYSKCYVILVFILFLKYYHNILLELFFNLLLNNYNFK